MKWSERKRQRKHEFIIILLLRFILLHFTSSLACFYLFFYGWPLAIAINETNVMKWNEWVEQRRKERKQAKWNGMKWMERANGAAQALWVIGWLSIRQFIHSHFTSSFLFVIHSPFTNLWNGKQFIECNEKKFGVKRNECGEWNKFDGAPQETKWLIELSGAKCKQAWSGLCGWRHSLTLNSI